MITSARLPGSSEPIWRVHARARARRRSSPCSSAVLRRHRARIARLQLVQERRLAHGLEHVEVVVARRAVGAEADVDARRAHRRAPAPCRSPASCCFRVVRDADVAARQDRDVGRRQPDAVRRERARPPEADRVEVRRRASSGTSAATIFTSSFVSDRWMRTGTWYAVGQRAHGLAASSRRSV